VEGTHLRLLTMILDDYFGRVLVISLPGAEARAKRALAELRDKGLSDRATVFRAVDGRVSTPSDWWQSGQGAWGCMQSHYRLVQDALLDGMETVMAIEDDCIWQRKAGELAAEFLSQVPDDWGQIYFGGQHRTANRPEWIDGRPAVLRARSVHRTHAYAIHRRIMPAFLKHIIYAPDYVSAAKARVPQKRHIDHQLEEAHRRGDWKVYVPSFWLAGQGENHSSINGKSWPAAWWHWSWRECHRRMPIVVCDREPTAEEMRWLHFGKHLLPGDATVDTGVRDCPTPEGLEGIFQKIAHEAFGCQRLPAIHGGWPDKEAWLRQRWGGPVLRLADAGVDVAALCDFPASKIVRHDWFNPRTEEACTIP